MNIKIAGQSSKSNYRNTGSCGGAVTYNEHELRELPELFKKLGVTPEALAWFDMDGHVVSGAEVMDKIGRLKAHLGKNEAKFYCVMINPSDEEALAMGATVDEQITNGQSFVYDVMDTYADNFHREGIKDRHNLVAYAIPHVYKSEGKLQIHWHGIVARKDASNRYKLSPLTNHKNTTKGAVKGGFNRVNFDLECERRFDMRYNYERRVEQSFDYLLAMKKGTAEEKAVQETRLALQNLPELEISIKTAFTRRVERLAKEANERAIKEHQAAEEKARIEADKQDRTRKNEFWNDFHSNYKPKYDVLKAACDSSFRLYQTAKERYGVTNQAISDRYTRLRSVYDEMNRRNDDVQRAKTAEGTWKAISALVFAMNPVAGILVGLVSCIVTEASVTAAVQARQALRLEAQGIKADIDTLKAEQAELRQDKSDRLKIYIENKEAKQELQNEINALKAALDKPLQPEAPVQPKPTVQKEPETPKRSLSDLAKQFSEYTASKAKATQEQKPLGLSSSNYAYSRKDEILTVFRSSGTPEALRRELASRGLTFQEVISRNGVTDITITASGEKSFSINASKFGQEYIRDLLDAYQKVSKRKPAYKTELEEITRAEDIRIAKATSDQSEARNIERKQQQAQKPENTPDTPHRSHTPTPGGGGGRGI